MLALTIIHVQSLSARLTTIPSLSQNQFTTNSVVLIRLINLHIDLVVGAKSGPSALQHQKVLLFNDRDLAAVALLRRTHKLAEAVAAQAMATLLDDDHLLVLKFLQARWTSEAEMKSREQPPTCHQSP